MIRVVELFSGIGAQRVRSISSFRPNKDGPEGRVYIELETGGSA